jgi:hypothetical protein
MSGGIEEHMDLTKMNADEKPHFWNILFQAYNKGSIVGCSINVGFDFYLLCKF